MVSKVDGALEVVGAFGKYQWWQSCLGAMGTFSASFHFLIIIFHSITPDHRCKILGWDNDTYGIQGSEHNSSIEYWIPRTEEGKYNSCYIFDYSNLNDSNSPSLTACSSYVFDKDTYWGTTLNERFNLVCENKAYSTVVKLVFTVGLLVGAAVVGGLSDWLGRRPAMIGCMIVGATAGVIATFSVNIYMFAVLRFILAMCFVGSALIAHCVVMEVTGPSKRPFAIGIKGNYWPIGQCILALMAYYIQDWNWLQFACSMPALLCGILQIMWCHGTPGIVASSSLALCGIPYLVFPIWYARVVKFLTIHYRFLKETPHFLVVKKRQKEAVAMFREMAKQNGRAFPQYLEGSSAVFDSVVVTEKLTSIFKSPTLLKRSFVFFYLWFIAGLSYYGLNFNVGNLTGSVFINTLISGLAEIPVTIIIIVSYMLGRKLLMVVSLMVGSAALLAAALMNVYIDLDVYGEYLIVVATIGKFAIAAVFIFDYLWSSEVFPTSLRTSLVGLCSLFARVGSMLSPVIVDMYMYANTPFQSGLGALIFSICMFVGGLLSLYLPETNKRKIPETIQEAEKFATANMNGHVKDVSVSHDTENLHTTLLQSKPDDTSKL